jgi:hypothetical protein
MKRLIFGVAAATLFSTAAWALDRCVIVTNGSIENYQHELSHCNGWQHPEFKPGYDPPLSFIHPFIGELTVWMVGVDYGSQLQTMPEIQFDAIIHSAPTRTVPELCGRLWKENGIVAAQTDIDHIIGCAVRK